jgi:hypothetical protein
MERKKLDTLIEKEAFQLSANIKTHAQSFMHLYSRKKGLKIEPELLNVLTDMLGVAIDDGFQTQVDIFNRGIAKALDQYTGEENPFLRTNSKKAVK